MTYRSQFNSIIDHLQPVDQRNSEDPSEEKKRRVLYQGRAWSEEEEELPIQPSEEILTRKKEQKKRPSAGVFADQVLLSRAQSLLDHMTTLEEKVAQLCFYETEAIYNSALQLETANLIQTRQVGGILFKKGDYRRQAYLIEHFQSVSKTALLIANDFLHGLSFYLQGDRFPQEELSEQHYCDLGKAVMVQNRRLGVHIQFDQERIYEKLPMNSRQSQAFRRGVREALGIVAKENITKNSHLNRSHSSKGHFPIFIGLDLQVQETIGFKTLNFFDTSKRDSKTDIHAAFLEQYNVFLVKANLDSVVKTICRLVRNKQIREEEIDRRVMKILTIKAFYFDYIAE